MRLLIINLLATAMLVFTAASASAYRVDMSSPQDGGTVGNGGQVVITVTLDTEGAGNIALLGTGIYFNTAAVSYNQAASSTTSYLLYVSSKQPYLVASPVCGGGYGSPNAGDGCDLWPGGGPTKVKLDFLSNSLPAAAPGTGVAQLAVLVFDVIDNTQTAVFSFSFDSAQGDILQLGDNTNPPLGLGADITVNVPEPTTALLIGLGLVGLGVAGRRNR